VDPSSIRPPGSVLSGKGSDRAGPRHSVRTDLAPSQAIAPPIAVGAVRWTKPRNPGNGPNVNVGSALVPTLGAALAAHARETLDPNGARPRLLRTRAYAAQPDPASATTDAAGDFRL
jgi:hypothetical protein